MSLPFFSNGILVFETDSDLAQVVHYVKLTPPSQCIDLAMPFVFEEIVLKCLANDSMERLQSVREMVVVLREVLLVARHGKGI